MPTPDRIACPNCQKQFAFKPELAGKKVKCPKCSNSFTVTPPAPAVDEYDLAPAPRPAPAAAPRYVAAPTQPQPPQKTYPTAGQEAATVLAASARLGARHGVVGLVGGLAVGGTVMAVRRKPKILLWALLGIAGLFALTLGLAFLSIMFRHHPAPPPPFVPPSPNPQAMPPQIPVAPPQPQRPTYESMVQAAGPEHVFRIHVDESQNVQRDSRNISSFLQAQTSGGFTMSSHDKVIEAALIAKSDFDTFVAAAKATPFLTVTETDTDQRIITVTMHAP